MPTHARRRTLRTRPARGALGASILALAGLASTYAQLIRPTSAYAAACANVSSQASLDTALQAIAAGTCDTIEITSSFALTASGYAVDISSGGSTAIVINGNGHTIDAGRDASVPGSGFRPFDFTLDSGDDLTISSLTIDGGYADDPMGPGGALTVTGDYSGVVVTLTEVTVTDTYAYDSGGAIYADVDDLVITDSVFNGNVTGDGDGGDLYFYGSGDLSISGSTFTDSECSDGGGSIYASGGSTLAIDSSTFVGGYAGGDGGGALYITVSGMTATITDTTFTDNTTSGSGGAIVMSGSGSTLTLDGVEISGSESVYGGGALYASVPTTITGSTLDDNYSGDDGGAVQIYGESLTASASTFSNNRTTADGGALFATNDVTLDSVSLVNNTANAGGGAVSAGVDADIVNSTLTGNAGTSGAVSTAGDMFLDFVTIHDNEALAGGSDASVTSLGDLTANATVIFGGTGVLTECSVAGTGTLDYVVTTDTSCGSATNSITNAVAGDLDLTLFDYGTPGGISLVPTPTSVLATAAPATDLGSLITEDQLGVARGPSGTAHSFAIGARQPGIAPAWTSSSPPATGNTATAVSYTFVASGTATIAYSLASGALPPGLNLDPATGALTGTPTTPGTYTWVVNALSPFGTADTATLSMTVTTAAVPTFTAETPPATGALGTAYSYTFAASGTAPISFAVHSGSLPPGLTLTASTGVLSGTPTTAGSYTFTVRASNVAGHDDTASITIVVSQGASAPARPKRPQILAHNRSVDVTVAPAGTGVKASRFVVTADRGGKGCTITRSSGGTCTVTGLTNGIAYRFTAVAVSAGGAASASSAPSEVAVPGSDPRPEAEDLRSRLRPGRIVAVQDGQRTPITVRPTDDDTAVTARAGSWSVRLAGTTSGGAALPLATGSVVVVTPGGRVATRGSGFKPNSTVHVYLDPPTAGGPRATLLVTLTTDDRGDFNGRGVLPDSVTAGSHVVQVVGLSRGNLVRALSLGVHVAGLPAAVRDLSAAWEGSRLEMTWTAPRTSAYDDITGYRVRVRLAQIDAWLWRDRTTSTQATTRAIPAGCAVVVRVAATTAAGRGPWQEFSLAAAAARSRVPAGDLRCR